MKKIVLPSLLAVLAVTYVTSAITLMAQQSGSLFKQTFAEASAKDGKCVSCHKNIEPMHASPAVKLGCVDCHGGDANATTKQQAHVQPRHPELWTSTANPVRSYAKVLDESPEFIKFVNPGDLRVAQETCGGCHQKQVNAVPRSTMTTSSVF